MPNSDATHINGEPNDQPEGPLPYTEIEQIIIDYSKVPIGQGVFSDVWYGIWTTTEGKTEVAIKKFRHTQKIADKGDEGKKELATLQKRLERELKSWKKADSHPNIVRLIGIYKEQPFPALVSPYLKDLDICTFLRDYEDKTQDIRRTLSHHIIKGVDHLHDLKIIHGDLKPTNILIYREGNGVPIAQITDFGRARVIDETGFTMGSLSMTPRYTAPEVIQAQLNPETDFNHSLTFESDIYSLGITLLEILSSLVPYQSLRNPAQFTAFAIASNAGLGPKLEQYESEYPMNWVWDLLERCWIIGDPLQRISAKNCLSTYHNKLSLSNHNVSGNLIGDDVALRN